MKQRTLLILVMLVVALAIVAEACGPNIIFRAYLDKALWRPSPMGAYALAAGLPEEKTTFVPYAGIAPAGGSLSLQRLRDAYRDLFPDQPGPYNPAPLSWPEPTIARLRELAAAASAANENEAHELGLLRCKIELRAAGPRDNGALNGAARCFESYLADTRPPALASEAQGWLARTDFLRGRQAKAAKFYMAELSVADSNIRRERLLQSLNMISPTREELEEYFDTPAHALFAADRITSFQRFAPLAAPLIEGLERHSDLFSRGAESSALAVALMRASTRMGAPEATLRFADRVPPGDPARESAEYNWLTGAARYQLKDYAGAETALMNVMKAADAAYSQQQSAAAGLVGVYAALKRPVDQLWAAFRADGDFDAAYLLDVQLTDAELEEYLKRYENTPDIQFRQYPLKHSAIDATRYALAVRYARRERYGEAAEIFARLQSPRAEQMRKAAMLFAETRVSGAFPDRQLEALYNYAVFLSDNEDKIFFNDALWNGFQTWAFISRDPDTDQPDGPAGWRAALSPEEVARYRSLERQLRDDQEEYWRAYKLLNQSVEKAGPTPLGRRAAERAIFCLRRIRTDRFGRAQEIASETARLSRWLGN
ncbi:MAG TPA: hypothetical protein VFY29_13975 [Terriglobia bacterium]|nr:hypothetical protein [Terriglobia bacterium]